MSNTQPRRFAYNDTSQPSTAGKEIAPPNDREYTIYSLRTVWTETPSSDVTHTADTIPVIRLIQTTDNVSWANEVIMAEYGTNGVVIADTSVTATIVWGEHVPWQSSDINGQFDYAFLPELVLSSGMVLRCIDANSTGAVEVIDVSGLFGITDRFGRRA